MTYITYEERVKRFDAFKRLRDKGATYQEIAEMFGVSRQRVDQIISSGKPKRSTKDTGILWRYGFGHLSGRERARMMVRIRDNFTCRDCGAVRKPADIEKNNARRKTLVGRIKLFDIHHINGQCGKNSRGYDSTADLSGMITLCHHCHFNRSEHTTHTAQYSRNVSKAQLLRRQTERVASAKA